LAEDANRLIRWQGWLDVDAFSASVLEQMQKQLGNGIETGKFTIAEDSINAAIENAKKEIRGFVENENLKTGGEGFSDLTKVKFYVWTYRHNYTDTGLYQLYVSVKGPMLIGKGYGPPDPEKLIPHRDIQSLRYEFGSDIYGGGGGAVQKDIYANVEIWRGAVIRVDAKGAITVVGNEAGVITIDNKGVERAPISDWERAPSLAGNQNYDPKKATGAEYVEPLERAIAIESNDVQKATGSIPKSGGDSWQDAQEQKRVNTVPAPRGWFRGR